MTQLTHRIGPDAEGDLCYVPLDGADVGLHPGVGRYVFFFPENGLTPGQRARWRASMPPGSIAVTRCPIIISDFQQDRVVIVEEGGTTRWPSFNTFGCGSDLIAAKLFGFSASYGDVAAEARAAIFARGEAGEDPDELIQEAYRVLGDSAERVYLVNGLMHKRDLTKKTKTKTA